MTKLKRFEIFSSAFFNDNRKPNYSEPLCLPMTRKLTEQDECIQRVRKRAILFYNKTGRRPRILLTRTYQQAPERDVKRIAAAMADMGFDVDLNTAVQKPEDMLRMALENDVHAVGIAGADAKPLKDVKQIKNRFNEAGRADICIALWEAAAPRSAKETLLLPPCGIERFGTQTDICNAAERILTVLGA